jgi:phosphoglycolate phosphatase-like HAD superfamily hydrolase
MARAVNEKPALILFDIDGTLLPPSSVHGAAFAYAFRTVYGLPLDISGLHASGRTDTWILAEPLRRAGLSDASIWSRLPEAYAAMDTYVRQHLGDLRHEVLPGVSEVLERLHSDGQLLGLLTGNLAGIAMTKMRQAGLDRYFNVGGFGEESDVRAHLVPVALDKASQLVGYRIPAHRAVVVGDTPLDVEAGRAHGTLTVSVATGAYTEDDLRRIGADLVLPSFADAPSAVAALLHLVNSTS